MLDGILFLWFTLTGLAVVFVIWDSITSTPTSWVQKLAWILVTVYTGPIGLFLYLLACRSPGRGMHDAFTQVHWKQSVNSEMHCLAGDATGIIFAAFVVSYFGLPNGIDLIFEYVSAFIVGPVHLPGADDEGDVWRLRHGGEKDLLCRDRVDEHGDGGHDPGHGDPDAHPAWRR